VCSVHQEPTAVVSADDSAQGFNKEADHAHIVQRAYELYEQWGRQDGQALEDWVKTERELGGAVHHM